MGILTLQQAQEMLRELTTEDEWLLAIRAVTVHAVGELKSGQVPSANPMPAGLAEVIGQAEWTARAR